MPKHPRPRSDRVIRAPKPILSNKPSTSASGGAGGAELSSSYESDVSKSDEVTAGYEAAVKLGWIAPPPKDAAAVSSTAEWNSLLAWARRQRGPQWDEATGFWQVDRNSPSYYSFASRPAVKTALDNAPVGASNPRAAPTSSSTTAAAAGSSSNAPARSGNAAAALYRASTEELTSIESNVTGMDPEDDEEIVASSFRRGPPRNRDASAREASPGPLGPGRASSSRFRR